MTFVRSPERYAIRQLSHQFTQNTYTVCNIICTFEVGTDSGMKHILLYISILLLTALDNVGARPAYDMTKLRMESLGRGVVAVRTSDCHDVISWRYLSSDSDDIMFNVYKNGKLITPKPIKETFLTATHTEKEDARYEVRCILNGKEATAGSYNVKAASPVGYIEIPVKSVADAVTPSGEHYSYYPGDASVGDVDGDGEYEIVVMMEPTNRHDNAHDGYTGNVYIDCYETTGEFLWRIDLGKNLRAGSHYTNMLVYDFDGDGKAEVVTRTCDGTKDSKGKIIGDPNVDWREHGDWQKEKKTGEMILKNQGRILKGKDYLTVFSGKTGRALHTIDYIPQRGNSQAWGDNRANRSDRFLAAVAYLDGKTPSIVMCRGYYTRSVLAAFDWNGKELIHKWTFDSDTKGNEDYAGQGFHNLTVGDVDSDGKDEIIYGSCTIDHDGKGLYTTKMGHGDAIHMTCFNPDSPKLQIWDCHENKSDGSSFRDAATGDIIFQIKSDIDVGRCMAADIDPTNHGVEMWSWCTEGLCNYRGETYTSWTKRPPMSMAIWWDGDLSRELLNKNQILKYRPDRKRCNAIRTFEGAEHINGTKATPCLYGDILGDWREEVILISEDHRHIRIYVTDIPTEYRFHTFMEDPIYRIGVAIQNVGYNQPTHTGFYFGTDLNEGIFRGYMINAKIK